LDWQVRSVLALAEERHLAWERTPLSFGRCVWPSEDDGSEEEEVSRKLAQALLDTADTEVVHRVCLQVRFGAGHEEHSFGLLLHRKPHPVSTVRFVHKNFPELEGCASFVYEGHCDTVLWEAHRGALEEYTSAWGFGVSRNRLAPGEQLQEAFQLVRLDRERRPVLEEMAVPRVESGCGIVVKSTYSTAECWLGASVGDSQQDQHQEPGEEDGWQDEEEGDDKEEAVRVEALLQNLSPFCASLGSRCALTCQDARLSILR
jgi:hypothetical protein